MKEVIIKNIRIPTELMELYSLVLSELEREFSEDVRLMIKMRIVSSGVISIETKRKSAKVCCS